MGALTSNDLLELFGSKPDEIEEEASRFKEMRDQWNEKVKQRIAERNGFNLQVQELITEVQAKKAVRDEANQKVKDLKKVVRTRGWRCRMWVQLEWTIGPADTYVTPSGSDFRPS